MSYQKIAKPTATELDEEKHIIAVTNKYVGIEKLFFNDISEKYYYNHVHDGWFELGMEQAEAKYNELKHQLKKPFPRPRFSGPPPYPPFYVG